MQHRLRYGRLMFDPQTLPQMPRVETGSLYRWHGLDMANRFPAGSLARRLAGGLDLVRKAVSLKLRPLQAVAAAAAAIPLLLVLCDRLSVLANRFARTVERGVPPRARRQATETAHHPADAPEAPAPAAPAAPATHAAPAAPAAHATPQAARPMLPRRLLWLQRLVPEALIGRSWTCTFIVSPEVVAQLAITPQAARYLRAICRLLDIALPEHLRLPRRPRAPRHPRRAPGSTAARRRPTPAPAPAAAPQAPPPVPPTPYGSVPSFTPHQHPEGSVVLTPGLVLGPGAQPGSRPPPGAYAVQGHAFDRTRF
jgi:hypothetical protein